MKKIINIRKVLLLTILFIFETANRCFADVYVSPIEEIRFAVPVLGVILVILGVIFVIALVCMLVAKINNSEELLSKSKNISENLLYYILVVIGLVVSVYLLSLFILGILGIISLIILYVSLSLRLKSKDKKASYIVLGTFLGLILLMFLSVL